MTTGEKQGEEQNLKKAEGYESYAPWSSSPSCSSALSKGPAATELMMSAAHDGPQPGLGRGSGAWPPANTSDTRGPGHKMGIMRKHN